MARYYVMALMETPHASVKRGIGYRSLWACHSGPYETRDQAVTAGAELPDEWRLYLRQTEYVCVDAFPVEHSELGIYGLSRKTPASQVMLPRLAGVK